MRKFRLQKLLDLKSWRERERAAALESARADAERADAAVRRLEVLREENRRLLHAASNSGRSVGELLSLRGVIEQLEAHIAAAHGERDQVGRTLDASMAAFSKASTDRRSFERLKERHTDLVRKALDSAERNSLDEIGLRRHALRRAAGGT